MLRAKGALLACFILHFLLIITIACNDVLWLVAKKLTILPSPIVTVAEEVTRRGSAIGQSLTISTPFWSPLLTYLHVTGIDRGYGYFAPNIPGGHRLIFELHYADGHVEYELPAVNSDAAGLRVTSLLDEIGRTRYDPLREYLVKTLARSVWREHPGATSIRAVFGVTVLPNLDEFEQGKRISYNFLYAYDFSRAENRDASAKP